MWNENAVAPTGVSSVPVQADSYTDAGATAHLPRAEQRYGTARPWPARRATATVRAITRGGGSMSRATVMVDAVRDGAAVGAAQDAVIDAPPPDPKEQTRESREGQARA